MLLFDLATERNRAFFSIVPSFGIALQLSLLFVLCRLLPEPAAGNRVPD